jgi:hypothetical protein
MDIRERLKDLNTKAYYLLVALSFLYGRSTGAPSYSLKIAIVLTAAVAVPPIQDYVPETWLRGIRLSKVIMLWAAFVSTLSWVWTLQ